jgi:hypothetical protein
LHARRAPVYEVRGRFAVQSLGASTDFVIKNGGLCSNQFDFNFNESLNQTRQVVLKTFNAD